MSYICNASFASFDDAIPHLGIYFLDSMKRLEYGDLQLIVPITNQSMKGDKIFSNVGDALYPKYSYCSGKNGKVKIISHYTMKQFVTDTAPFVLESINSTYNKIIFKVIIINMIKTSFFV